MNDNVQYISDIVPLDALLLMIAEESSNLSSTAIGLLQNKIKPHNENAISLLLKLYKQMAHIDLFATVLVFKGFFKPLELRKEKEHMAKSWRNYIENTGEL